MGLEQPSHWRRLLKDLAASAIWRVYATPWSRPPMSADSRPLIIAYHRVVDDFAAVSKTDMPTMLVGREMFERHLDRIGRRFEFTSLDDIGDHIARGVPFRRPVAAVTFDDGYRDVYEHAFPVLKRKGIPAAVFVVTGLIGKSSWQIHDRLYNVLARAYGVWNDPWAQLTLVLRQGEVEHEIPGLRAASRHPCRAASALLPALSVAEAERVMDLLERQMGAAAATVPKALTWPMIAELRRAGFTIGSHTRRHAWLANESERTRVEEIAGSKLELETRLNEPVLHFAYPGGQFTAPVVDVVARAGYRYAYTICDHHDRRHPSLTIDRLLLWEGSSIGANGQFSPSILNRQTHGLWPPLRRCEQLHAV